MHHAGTMALAPGAALPVERGDLPCSRRRAIREAIEVSQEPGPACADVSYATGAASTPKGAERCAPPTDDFWRPAPSDSATCHAGSKSFLRMPGAVASGGL